MATTKVPYQPGKMPENLEEALAWCKKKQASLHPMRPGWMALAAPRGCWVQLTGNGGTPLKAIQDLHRNLEQFWRERQQASRGAGQKTGSCHMAKDTPKEE